MNAITKRASGGLSLVLLVALFVGLTLVFNQLFRGAQIDLTANNEYTLSEGTEEILNSLDEPINLYFYFSEEASRDLPQIRTYATRVRELLEEMAGRAGGKIRLQVIDPQPFSEEEDEATAYGLQSVPLGNTGDKLFFGLAGTNSTNGKVAVPFFQPDKEAFLEYDVAKAIHNLVVVEKPEVGLITSLPMSGGFDPASQQMSDPWAVMQQLNELFTVQVLGTDTKTIDAKIKVLMLVHPKELPADTQYAIDQFVLRGGRLIVFLDPNANADQSGADPNNPSAAMFANKSSNLETLLKAWGINYNPDQVVVDRSLGLQVQINPAEAPVRHPLVLGLTKAQANQQDLVSADLESINVDSVGHLKQAEGSAFKLEPLLQSSTEATTVSSERIRFLPDPRELLKDFTPSGEAYVIAARASGKFKTAFPDKSSEAGHLAEAAEDAQIMVFADTDLLTDRLWVSKQNFFGQRLLQAFANNGDLIVNALDNLTGSSALISIRGRASSQRPFTVVEEMRRAAEEKFRSTEESLQQELNETETKLTELQQGKAAGDEMILSPEQQAEIERFQAEKLRIRKELRDVRRSLDQDIESLGTTLKVINIALVPLLVIGLALAYGGLRRNRRRAAQQGA